MDDNLRLLIKKDAVEQLKSGAVAREQERMKARIKAEEERQIARRAKQEQIHAQRVAKRAHREAAKNSEALLEARCSALEAVLDAHIGKKSELDKLAEEKKTLEAKIQDAVARRRKAQAKEAELDKQYRTLCAKIEQANKPDRGDKERALLQQAWDQNEQAWGSMQTALRKKLRNRGLKKRAKGLLGL